jgi:hypothetical protein
VILYIQPPHHAARGLTIQTMSSTLRPFQPQPRCTP